MSGSDSSRARLCPRPLCPTASPLGRIPRARPRPPPARGPLERERGSPAETRGAEGTPEWRGSSTLASTSSSSRLILPRGRIAACSSLLRRRALARAAALRACGRPLPSGPSHRDTLSTFVCFSSFVSSSRSLFRISRRTSPSSFFLSPSSLFAGVFQFPSALSSARVRL